MTSADFKKLAQQLTPEAQERIRQSRARLMGELGLYKQAQFGTMLKGTMANALAGSLALTAVGVGSGLINKAIDTISDAYYKKSGFDAMKKLDPALGDHPDQMKVQRNFNTLYNFAPEMAKDPNVAASFVKNTMEYDVIDHRTVADLAKATKDLATAAKVNSESSWIQTPGMNVPLGTVPTPPVTPPPPNPEAVRHMQLQNRANELKVLETETRLKNRGLLP